MFHYAMLALFYFLLTFHISVHAKYTEYSSCPQDYDCTWIYPYFVTQYLKCADNNQCPNGFLCCPDCHYQHSICKEALWIADTPKMQCPKTKIICKQKFPFLGTQKFKCTTNEECDNEFLCCVDNCYEHKICKKAIPEDVCPKDLKLCSHPLSLEKTKKYKCIAHSQCQKERYCCFDSCYTHKVCKRQLDASISDKNCPLSIRKESCPNTNLTLPKYACNNNEDCIFGYKCCQDNCYNHKVCKLSKGSFSYQETYKPQSLRISSFDEQHKCPKVKEKCTKPYSLRLAKKFICFKDADCKIGQLCCKDSCVKDFKICKTIFTLKPEQVITLNKLLDQQGVQNSMNLSKSVEKENDDSTQTIIPNVDNQTLEMVMVSSTDIPLEKENITVSVSKIHGEEMKIINYEKTVTKSIENVLTMITDPSSFVPATIRRKGGRKKLKLSRKGKDKESIIKNKGDASTWEPLSDKTEEVIDIKEPITKPIEDASLKQEFSASSSDDLPPTLPVLNTIKEKTLKVNPVIATTKKPETNLEEPSLQLTSSPTIDDSSATIPIATISKENVSSPKSFYKETVTRIKEQSMTPYSNIDGIVILDTTLGNNLSHCFSGNLSSIENDLLRILLKGVATKTKLKRSWKELITYLTFKNCFIFNFKEKATESTFDDPILSKNRNNPDAEFYFDKTIDKIQEGSGSNDEFQDGED